jgi:hypothetical protein
VICKFCGSPSQKKFRTEMAIHADREQPLVFVFPEIFACLSCGKAQIVEEYVLPENELGLLAEGQNKKGHTA